MSLRKASFASALAAAFGTHAFRMRHTTGRFGPYRPHQSARECARRRGGQNWRDYKAVDRVRRGLPVEG